MANPLTERRRSLVRRTDLGARIHYRRRQLDLSIEELAAACRIHPGYLRYIEDGPAYPPSDTLQRVAVALRTDVPTLLGYRSRLGG